MSLNLFETPNLRKSRLITAGDWCQKPTNPSQNLSRALTDHSVSWEHIEHGATTRDLAPVVARIKALEPGGQVIVPAGWRTGLIMLVLQCVPPALWFVRP